MTLHPGKLPEDALAGLLARITHRDPRVLVGPGIGRDAAVIDIGGGRVLVAKMDPVTFAAEDIGWYAVNVNANDIACMGGRPAWFMATALLPPGAPDDLPARIFDQLQRACDALGVELVGGHTEVTVGLTRPMIAGAMLGEADAAEIVGGQAVAPGDVVLLANGIAIEGTALLARERMEALVRAGVGAGVIERAQGLLYEPGISVVRDAGALRALVRPRLLHDPTEGGLATALHELAAAAGARIRVDLDRVPVLEETRAICDALDLDPMGLLASGALLAIVGKDDYGHVTGELASRWRAIGEAVAGAPAVILGAEGSAIPLRTFARDELARFLEGAAAAGDAGDQHSGEDQHA